MSATPSPYGVVIPPSPGDANYAGKDDDVRCVCAACGPPWRDRSPKPEPGTVEALAWHSWMALCPGCGSKRCSGAADHRRHPSAPTEPQAPASAPNTPPRDPPDPLGPVGRAHAERLAASSNALLAEVAQEVLDENPPPPDAPRSNP